MQIVTHLLQMPVHLHLSLNVYKPFPSNHILTPKHRFHKRLEVFNLLQNAWPFWFYLYFCTLFWHFIKTTLGIVFQTYLRIYSCLGHLVIGLRRVFFHWETVVALVNPPLLVVQLQNRLDCLLCITIYHLVCLPLAVEEMRCRLKVSLVMQFRVNLFVEIILQLLKSFLLLKYCPAALLFLNA